MVRIVHEDGSGTGCTLYKNLGNITRVMCRELKSSCWAENSWLSFKKEEEKESKIQIEVR